MPKSKKDKMAKEKGNGSSNPTSGPGSVDGTGTDSPIIITDGSCQIISINDDFHPTALRSNGSYSISKSNGGTIVIRPDALKANAANGLSGATCTITLTDINGKTVIIIATPAPSANYYTWLITVTTTLTAFNRFDMNGGESRIAHPDFKIASGTVTVGAGPAQPLLTPKHITIHFR